MNNHDLDKLIHDSLQAEPSRQQLARIEDFWREQSKAVTSHGTRRLRRFCRPKYWAAAIATTIMVAVATSLCLWMQEPSREPVATKLPTPIEPTVSGNKHVGEPKVVVAAESQPKDDSPSAGRPPTAYERIFFAAATRKSVAAEQSSMIAKIDTAIGKLVLDPEDNVEQLAKSLRSTQCDTEGLLLRRLLRSKDDRKRAVMQLLAVCGTRRSTLHLLRLSKREAFRAEALTAVERIVGVEQLAQLASQTDNRHVRAAIYERLLGADSEPALRGYLFLVSSEAYGAEALAAADTVSGPLLQRLLDLLKDKDEGVRLAAAMVLGHANGPEVADALIELVTTKKDPPSSPAESWNPTEAWIAIMACRSRQTEEFLSYVQCQPKLLGQFNRAMARLAQITL